MIELRVSTTPGAEKILAAEAVEQLRSGLRGWLLRAADTGYGEWRRIFNAMIDKRPALIVRCVSAGDVLHAFRFAREHEALIAVRWSGHSVGDKAVRDGGILMDLSLMKGIRVDPVGRTVRSSPSAVTRSTESRLSQPRPYLPFSQPSSPPRDTGLRPGDANRPHLEHRHRWADAIAK